MGIDIYNSRRTSHHKVYYWKGDKKNKYEMNELVYSQRPSGFFYANETNAISQRNEIVGGVFKVDKKQTMLKVNDDIGELNVDDIVKYKNKYWVVVDIQQTSSLKESEFSSKEHCVSFLTIRC